MTGKTCFKIFLQKPDYECICAKKSDFVLLLKVDNLIINLL